MSPEYLRFKRASPWAKIRLLLLSAICAILVVCAWFMMIRMPGQSYRGPLPALTEAEAALRDALRRDVEKLAGEIGERNCLRPDRLSAAAGFIQTSLEGAGYHAQRQEFQVAHVTCCNIEAQIAGRELPDDVVIVGAHYDSVIGSPGANDNGSAVAALLALARAFAGEKVGRTLRFVAFANEEAPYFKTDGMGSLVYARRCRQRGEKIVAMLSLETIGYYTDAAGSQQYPFPLSLFYPSTGNFIGFVGNVSSRHLVREVVGSFRRHARFPSEGAAMPGFITGVDWSDQWSFWHEGYPALMVTDTAPFRYPHYHQASDTPDKLTYDRIARVVAGLKGVVEDLVTAHGE